MMILREGLCPGLTADIISVLKKNHVRTVVDLVAADLEELARKCSLSYKTLVAVRRVLLAQYAAFPSNGADLYEELKASTAILPTGNKKLDSLLDSGLYTGEVTEIAGAPGSGKTQLSLHWWVQTLSRWHLYREHRKQRKFCNPSPSAEEHGIHYREMCQSIAVNVATSLQQGVCYIDTTGGLTGTRLLQLIQCKAQQEDEQVASLEIIQVIHVFDAYKLLDVLQDLRHSFSQQLLRSGKTLRLVVVDSVCAVIYPLLGGKQTEGMAVMMYLARELQTLAHDFSLAVLVTNHITRDGSTGFRPALGRSWSFVPSTRIQIQRDERNKQSGNRLMSLVKSSRQPTNLQVEVEIGPCGIFEQNVTTASGS